MSRPFARAFYDSALWARTRAYILRRDRYMCTRCHNPAQEVHHIIRLSVDNINDPNITINPDNLISLCRDCHFKEHEQEKLEASAKKHGKSYGDCREGFHFDENGMLVPDEE